MDEFLIQQQQREERRAKLLAIHRKRSLSATSTTAQPLPKQGSEAVVWGSPTGTNSSNIINRRATLEHDSAPSSPRLQRVSPKRRKILNSNNDTTAAATSTCTQVKRLVQSCSSSNRKQQKLEKLNSLRQKRVALAARVEGLRMSIHHLQGDTLRSQLMKQSTSSPRTMSPNHQTEQSTTTRDSNNDSSRKLLLPLELRQMRQRQCLAAAYRLSGISLLRLPTDPNVLAIRLDVLSACYHCFFDVITLEKHHDHRDVGSAADSRNKNKTNEELVVTAADSNGRHTFLRLVQHTLPSAIPLTAILQRHMGGLDDMAELTLVPPPTADSPTLLDQLRGCANELYHACYCWTVRNESVRYLEELAAGSSPERPSTEFPLVGGTTTTARLDYSLDHLRVYSSSTATHQPQNHHYPPQKQQQSSLSSGNFTISFQLHHRLSGISVVAVTLQYPADLCRPRAHQPLQVTVRTCRGRRAKSSANSIQYHHGRRHHHHHHNNNSSSDEDENDEDEYYDEFVEGAILSFRRFPIREALQEVVDAMQLY